MWSIFIIAAIVLFVLWLMIRPHYDFRIDVGRHGTRLDGRISQAQRSKIQEYFNNTDLSVTTMKICGRHEQNGLLKLQFHGGLREGERQMIRNFLLTVF